MKIFVDIYTSSLITIYSYAYFISFEAKKIEIYFFIYNMNAIWNNICLKIYTVLFQITILFVTIKTLIEDWFVILLLIEKTFKIIRIYKLITLLNFLDLNNRDNFRWLFLLYFNIYFKTMRNLKNILKKDWYWTIIFCCFAMF